MAVLGRKGMREQLSRCIFSGRCHIARS
jgi:hypothetical protein